MNADTSFILPTAIKEALEVNHVHAYIHQLGTSLNYAAAIAFNAPQDLRRSQYIAAITPIKGIPFYGYHVGYSYFLKIYLFNPDFESRIVDLMRSGAIMATHFQPFEAHVPYRLQFFIDFNLFGMGWLELEDALFRNEVPEAEPGDSPLRMIRASIGDTRIWARDKDPGRISHCELEMDTTVDKIVNRDRVLERDLHKNLDECFQPPSSTAQVPSVASLWEDDARRRKVLNLPSQEPPMTQARDKEGIPWLNHDFTKHMVADLVKEMMQSSQAEKLHQLGATFETFKVKEDPLARSFPTAYEAVDYLCPRVNKVAAQEEQEDEQSQDASFMYHEAESSILVDESIIASQSALSQPQELMGAQQGLFPGLEALEGDVQDQDGDNMSLPDMDMDEFDLEDFMDDIDIWDELGGLDTETHESSAVEGAVGSGSDSNDPPEIGIPQFDGGGDDWQDTRKDQRVFEKEKSDRRRNKRKFRDKLVLDCIEVPTRVRHGYPEPASPDRDYFIAKMDGMWSSPSPPLERPAFIFSPPRATSPGHDDSHHVSFSETTPYPTGTSMTNGVMDDQEQTGRMGNGQDLDNHFVPSRSTSVPDNGVEPVSPRIYLDMNNEMKKKRGRVLVEDSFEQSQLNLTPDSPDSLPDSRPSQADAANTIATTTATATTATTTTTTTNTTNTTTTTTTSRILQFMPPPPTVYELQNSFAQYGLPDFVHQKPYYSNEADVSAQPKVFGGKEFKLQSHGLNTMKPFKSQLGYTTTAPYAPGDNFKYWEPVQVPPTAAEIKAWLEEEDRRAKASLRSAATASTQKRKELISQIEGPTQKNPFGYKTSPTKVAGSIALEKDFMDVLSLEVHCETRGGLLPDPKHDRILAVFYCWHADREGVVSNGWIPGYRLGVITHAEAGLIPKLATDLSGSDIIVANDEGDMLNATIRRVLELDPDILAGYEVNNLSWGYLVDRYLTLFGLDMSKLLSRIRPLRPPVLSKSAKEARESFNSTHTSGLKFQGRHLFNVWRLIRTEIALTNYSFCNVVFHALQQSVISRGSQYKVESLMVRLGKPENFLMVSPSRAQVGAQRALEFIPMVMEPESGFYEDPVVVLDFQSLYPSVMIAYNYCYSTCLGKLGGGTRLGVTEYKIQDGILPLFQDHLKVAPNNMMYVNKDIRKSLLARMLTELLETRVMVKKAMREYPDNKSLLKLLDARQLGLKFIANVTYGYTSASFSGRMPATEIADSIVSSGRETLERAIRFVNEHPKWNAKVVYGDTDSMFVHLKGRTREEAFAIGYDISETITKMNPRPVKLKFEKVYHPCFLVTKKRYVGASFESPHQTEPIFDAKGIETIRRDGIVAAQKIMETSIKTQDLSSVKSYFVRQLTKILDGRIPVPDLMFGKAVKMERYSENGVPPPGAVVSARRMDLDPRAQPQYGERVPYVVVHGDPGARLTDQVVEPKELLKNKDLRLNGEYYIRKMIIPSLERILQLAGADVKSWFEEMPRVKRAVPLLMTDPSDVLPTAGTSALVAAESDAAIAAAAALPAVQVEENTQVEAADSRGGSGNGDSSGGGGGIESKAGLEAKGLIGNAEVEGLANAEMKAAAAGRPKRFKPKRRGGKGFVSIGSRIDRYYQSQLCLICGKLVAGQGSIKAKATMEVCSSCCRAAPNGGGGVQRTMVKTSSGEIAFAMKNPLSDGGKGLESVACESIECNVFWQRRKAQDSLQMSRVLAERVIRDLEDLVDPQE
ncbi:DNA polymerase zeta [Podila epigama]|nr:DNA polymerase zeta [Podila epigama]